MKSTKEIIKETTIMDEKEITFADLLEIVSPSVNMVRWVVKDTKEDFGEIIDYYLDMKVIEFYIDIDIISGIKRLYVVLKNYTLK